MVKRFKSDPLLDKNKTLTALNTCNQLRLSDSARRAWCMGLKCPIEHILQEHKQQPYDSGAQPQSSLVQTVTTRKNLLLLTKAMETQRPILLMGSRGCGKNSLISHFNPSRISLCADSKHLLLGSYVAREPGKFTWCRGPLARAAEDGLCVLFEDIHLAPVEVLSMLVPLFEHRTLLLPHCSQTITAHPRFKIFATATQSLDFASALFTIVNVNSQTLDEYVEIMDTLYPHLRNITPKIVEIYSTLPESNPRHLFNVASRINKINTSTLYMLSVTNPAAHLDEFVLRSIVLEFYDVCNVSLTHISGKCTPQIVHSPLKIGRISFGVQAKGQSEFIYTRHALRLLEQVAVCVYMDECALLCGETSTGKTTVVQHLAHLLNKKLHVINLSQQSDSSDLIGCYRPVTFDAFIVPLHETFHKLFLATFAENVEFLAKVTRFYQLRNWPMLMSMFKKGIKKAKGKESVLWAKFEEQCCMINGMIQDGVDRFSRQLLLYFIEGNLVTAVRNGDWVLLDEINLASAETLELLTPLLCKQSIILTEKGDEEAVVRHKDFRLFGCMNPATDVGKKNLPIQLREKFTEIHVDAPDNADDLLVLVTARLKSNLHTDRSVAQNVVMFYLEAKKLAETCLYDGAGFRPNFSLRTLTRSLKFATTFIGVFPLRRGLYEGIQMAFTTILDINSQALMLKLMNEEILQNDMQLLKRAHVTGGNRIMQLFLENSFKTSDGYILTPSIRKSISNLARAVMSEHPILIQGPTSSGKTSMIHHLAKLTNHKFVRINHHAHTDLQEYFGSYVNVNGKLIFKEGALVTALRQGHWVVLDELNLAPTDVLESLNRLLDDNRELYVCELNETIKPHSNFMLFATQNPPSYSGRKQISRALRNRFIELHFSGIPDSELEEIVTNRCLIPPSYAKKIVLCYIELSRRRGESKIFDGSGLMSLRDLFKWADRPADNYQTLAENGYLVIGERLRTEAERDAVLLVLQNVFRLKLDPSQVYNRICADYTLPTQVVWNMHAKRLFALIVSCVQNKEPVLLVGETGCGKTLLCQIVAQISSKELRIVNCHQHSDTSDFIGSQRPAQQLFMWQDGPLVKAMKKGDYFLLDEISLADDSVLERLNSVLEATRTLLIAEKGGDIEEVTAHNDFRFLATMNPGGDYGKKELSPALRNRFTEIYTRVDSRQDLLEILQAKVDLETAEKMLDYCEWLLSKRYVRAVSIRDYVAWAEFIITHSHLDSAIYHGGCAILCDGIRNDEFRVCAITKLAKLWPVNEKQQIVQTETTFGVDPFYICAKSVSLEHAFTAPTARDNVLKVLRAMQIQEKSILLMGSPGVGKTSLVEAIAKLSGNNLLRINLSEQTDILDLFGTDLPVEGTAGQFSWRDGPFLSALKNGYWVLLDELNLASQSVLEGLNACLDYRGTVYIPELDKSFIKHKNFRVFAAQNPMEEGGGRRGLPKSFLNRFCSIYLSVYTEVDYLEILNHLFGQINVKTLLHFNIALHEDVNLRDILRWFELKIAVPNISTATLLDVLYIQKSNQQHVLECYEAFFPKEVISQPEFEVSKNIVRVGAACIQRDDFYSPTKVIVPHSMLRPLQALLLGFQANWMVMLRGPSQSGKTMLCRSAASICGKELVEYYMHPGIDALELLGGFEQVDQSRYLTRLLKVLESQTYLAISHAARQGNNDRVNDLQLMLNTENYKEWIQTLGSFAGPTAKLLERYEMAGNCAGKFEWVDSILLNAIRDGKWVLLENANLCSPSVLDRLNPLFENNGQLLINERGMDQNGNYTIIKPHKDFRLVMTLNPKYGNLSKAMKNRGLEVHLSENQWAGGVHQILQSTKLEYVPANLSDIPLALVSEVPWGELIIRPQHLPIDLLNTDLCLCLSYLLLCFSPELADCAIDMSFTLKYLQERSSIVYDCLKYYNRDDLISLFEKATCMYPRMIDAESKLSCMLYCKSHSDVEIYSIFKECFNSNPCPLLLIKWLLLIDYDAVKTDVFMTKIQSFMPLIGYNSLFDYINEYKAKFDLKIQNAFKSWELLHPWTLEASLDICKHDLMVIDPPIHDEARIYYDKLHENCNLWVWASHAQRQLVGQNFTVNNVPLKYILASKLLEYSSNSNHDLCRSWTQLYCCVREVQIEEGISITYPITLLSKLDKVVVACAEQSRREFLQSLLNLMISQQEIFKNVVSEQTMFNARSQVLSSLNLDCKDWIELGLKLFRYCLPGTPIDPYSLHLANLMGTLEIGSEMQIYLNNLRKLQEIDNGESTSTEIEWLQVKVFELQDVILHLKKHIQTRPEGNEQFLRLYNLLQTLSVLLESIPQDGDHCAFVDSLKLFLKSKDTYPLYMDFLGPIFSAVYDILNGITQLHPKCNDKLGFFVENQESFDGLCLELESLSCRGLVKMSVLRKISQVYSSMLIQEIETDELPWISGKSDSMLRSLSAFLKLTKVQDLNGMEYANLIQQYNVSLKSTLWHSIYSLATTLSLNNQLNVYTDFDGAEVQKLVKILYCLNVRVGEIMKAWPQHAVLQEIIYRSGTIANTPSDTPLIKIMELTECLVAKCDEWEKYASKEVSIRQEMNILSQIIVSWRQLELQNWKNLLLFCNEEHNKKAAGLWMTLLLVADTDAENCDIIIALDEYLLNSTLGEFSLRLDILLGISRLFPKCVFSNIYYFYMQFLPLANSHLEKKEDIKQELQNHVKIASWRDTNIYSLRESARKTHIQLQKCVQNYRELLNTPVAIAFKEVSFLENINTPDKSCPCVIVLKCDGYLKRGMSLSKTLCHVEQFPLTLMVIELISEFKAETDGLSPMSEKEATIFIQTRKRAFADFLKALKDFKFKRIQSLPSKQDMMTSAAFPETQFSFTHLLESASKYFFRLCAWLPFSLNQISNDLEPMQANRLFDYARCVFKMVFDLKSALAKAVVEYERLSKLIHQSTLSISNVDIKNDLDNLKCAILHTEHSINLGIGVDYLKHLLIQLNKWKCQLDILVNQYTNVPIDLVSDWIEAKSNLHLEFLEIAQSDNYIAVEYFVELFSKTHVTIKTIEPLRDNQSVLCFIEKIYKLNKMPYNAVDWHSELLNFLGKLPFIINADLDHLSLLLNYFERTLFQASLHFKEIAKFAYVLGLNAMKFVKLGYCVPIEQETKDEGGEGTGVGEGKGENPSEEKEKDFNKEGEGQELEPKETGIDIDEFEGEIEEFDASEGEDNLMEVDEPEENKLDENLWDEEDSGQREQEELNEFDKVDRESVEDEICEETINDNAEYADEHEDAVSGDEMGQNSVSDQENEMDAHETELMEEKPETELEAMDIGESGMQKGNDNAPFESKDACEGKGKSEETETDEIQEHVGNANQKWERNNIVPKDDKNVPEGQDYEHHDEECLDQVIQPSSNFAAAPISDDLTQHEETVKKLEEWKARPENNISESHDVWLALKEKTFAYANELTEQLRIILEPTVASQLMGDYKTGKRINMRRILAYIASDFKKDKIWLRRTKEAKRNYQVLLAVDDSMSMSDTNSIQLAFESVCLLAQSLEQLEVGPISVCSFGACVKEHFSFGERFTDEAGARVINEFRFMQTKTNIEELLESAVGIYDKYYIESASQWRLMIIVSDALCNDHAKLKNLVKRAAESRILTVFLVLDVRSTDSIMTMESVKFENGKVKMSKYMDSFPFDYYVVINNIKRLPHVLAESLRQFFALK